MERTKHKLTLVVLTNNCVELDLLRKYKNELHCKLLIVFSNGQKEIDKDYIVFKFNGNFSDLRNYALSKVNTEWVLFLDADERLSKELLEEIPRLIEEKATDGYWLSRRTFISPIKYLRHGLFYPDFQLRLFRVQPVYRFVGAVHEIVVIPKEKTKEVRLDILHYPENQKYTKFSDYKNMSPYITIHTEELLKLGKSSSYYFFSGFLKGTLLFVNGFFRGKGFLDGWDGFRAHFIFSLSIMSAYFHAAYEIHNI